jgi:hypothetical protein
MQSFHSLLNNKNGSKKVLRKRSVRKTPPPGTPNNAESSVVQQETPAPSGEFLGKALLTIAAADSPDLKDVMITTIEEVAEEVIDDPIFDDSAIDRDAIVELATRTRGIECRISREPHSAGNDWIGFVQFLDDIEWIVRLPKPRLSNSSSSRAYSTETFQNRCKSIVATIECVATRTTLPVPRVHHFDCSSANTLKRPYILMDCLPGQALSSVLEGLKDHQIRAIIRQWAEYTMELSKLQFPTIGSLYKEGEEFVVGKLQPKYDTASPGNSGPFKSVGDYILLSSINKKRSLVRSNLKVHGSLLRATLIDSLFPFIFLPEFLNGPFTLSHRSLDIDSILVDSDGRLTGILGWQDAAVLPLQSHIHVPDSLNLEFLPPSETNASPSRIIFAKRYRRHFERALAEASPDTDWDVPDLIDRSLMYGLFEKAILDGENEKYLPALWEHIFGKEEQAETLRNAMRKSKWGIAVLNRLKRLDVSARRQSAQPRGADDSRPRNDQAQQL